MAESDADIWVRVASKYREQYDKLVYEEGLYRELPFVPITWTIGKPKEPVQMYWKNGSVSLEEVEGSTAFSFNGVDVKLLTLYHNILLENVKSPFTTWDRTPAPEDIAVFLWIVSTDYKDNDPVGRDKFIKTKAAHIPYQQGLEEIVDYMIKNKRDYPFAPTNEEEDRRGLFPAIPYYSNPAAYIMLIAMATGWTKETILHLPYIELYQYVKFIVEAKAIDNRTEPSMWNALTTPLEQKITKEYLTELDKQPKE